MAQDLSAYHPHSLPRLDPSCYQSDATVVWTLTTRDRGTGWLNDRLHLQFRELLLHAAARDALLCPAYVLMPDHIHLIWIGLEPNSDQRNAMAFLRTHLSRLIAPTRLQPQPHDHVLTSEERTKQAFARFCQYILLNPVRAKLTRTPDQWSYSGCVLLGYAGATPFNTNYWPWFWKIFQNKRDPTCAKHIPIRRLFPTPP